MPRVRYTTHLRRFFPDLADEEVVSGCSIADVVQSLNRRHPGLADYVIDECGALRQHVNIFVDDELARDRLRLTDPVSDESVVFILQALSGG